MDSSFRNNPLRAVVNLNFRCILNVKRNLETVTQKKIKETLLLSRFFCLARRETGEPTLSETVPFVSNGIL